LSTSSADADSAAYARKLVPLDIGMYGATAGTSFVMQLSLSARATTEIEHPEAFTE
jgi:hypothetical protein